MEHVSTDLQIANILIKGLVETKFERLRKVLMNW